MVLIPKTKDIDETIKEQYKVEAKFFQDYDCPPQWSKQPIASNEQNLDPFKKVNWKNLKIEINTYAILSFIFFLVHRNTS